VREDHVTKTGTKIAPAVSGDGTNVVLQFTDQANMAFWQRDARQWREMTVGEVMTLRNQRISQLPEVGDLVLV
jgi:hypothetical protein